MKIIKLYKLPYECQALLPNLEARGGVYTPTIGM